MDAAIMNFINIQNLRGKNWTWIILIAKHIKNIF